MSSNLPYQHRQVGWLTIIALGFGLIVTTTLFPQTSASAARWMLASVLVLLGVLTVLFWSLSVRVTVEQVNIWFGPGVIRRRIRIADIRGAHAVRNKWYYGWGIRLTPYGWLFNVSGFDAVEFEFTNGKRFRVGTDDPVGLLSAVQSAMAFGRR